jgi:DNA-binding NtrC family response regulator
METPSSRTNVAGVVVVDAAVRDYHCLADWATNQTIRLTIASCGAGGLRLVPSHCDALWLVGLTLPDMSGFELLEMIQSVQPQITTYAIDSSYAADRERRALELSAARYLCKPVRLEWIHAWRGFSRLQTQASQAEVRLDSQSDAPSPNTPLHKFHRKEKRT